MSFEFLLKLRGWWVTGQQAPYLLTILGHSFITRYTFVLTWRRGTTFLCHWVRFSCACALSLSLFFFVVLVGQFLSNHRRKGCVITVQFTSASWLTVTLGPRFMGSQANLISNVRGNGCNSVTFTLTAWLSEDWKGEWGGGAGNLPVGKGRHLLIGVCRTDPFFYGDQLKNIVICWNEPVPLTS